MQSITTKYLPATDTKGSRIKATASGGGGSVTIPYRSQHSTEHNHCLAVRTLCQELDWHGTLAYDHGQKGSGMVFVFVRDDNTVEV